MYPIDSSVPAHTTTKPFSRWVLAPGLVLLSLLLVISFSEWLTVGVIKAPADIAGYPFGSEEAMSDGGWYYQSAELYARQMLISWVTLLPSAWLFARALGRCTSQRLAWAYGLFIVTCLVSTIINQLHTP